MDLPSFRLGAPIKVRRATGGAAGNSPWQILMRGHQENWGRGGLPGLFGIFPSKGTIHTPGRGRREITHRDLLMRARQIAFDPTQIPGIGKD